MEKQAQSRQIDIVEKVDKSTANIADKVENLDTGTN